jgi:hypothetical protein
LARTRSPACCSPNLTVAETKRLEKIGKAVDELLDKVG